MIFILNYSWLLTYVKSLYKSNTFATIPFVSELPLQMVVSTCKVSLLMGETEKILVTDNG
jgi:hypothetical protein